MPLWRGLNIFSATEISRMGEVQFTAELAMALIDGMSDFSAARVDRAYKQWDEDSPERDSVSTRLERVYKKIVELNPESVRDTIFSRSPVFFSRCLFLMSLTVCRLEWDWKKPSPRSTRVSTTHARPRTDPKRTWRLSPPAPLVLSE